MVALLEGLKQIRSSKCPVNCSPLDNGKVEDLVAQSLGKESWFSGQTKGVRPL